MRYGTSSSQNEHTTVVVCSSVLTAGDIDIIEEGCDEFFAGNGGGTTFFCGNGGC